MANRRPNFKIPDIINPPDRRCIQISVPDDEQHLQIFAGLIRQLSDWQRWEREPTKSGTLVAQVWRDVWQSIDWIGDDCMGCCPEPTNRRYNDDGMLEVSYDNGETWEVNTTEDDRHSGQTAPPLQGVDGDDKKCIGATAAQEFIKVNLIDDLTTGATYADVYAALVALVAVFGVTGIGILVAAAAAAIFIAGVSAVQAAFTSDVWDDFKCILYCAIEDDASFTIAGWQTVKNEVNAQFNGIAAIILHNWINTVGSVGLTNAARSSFATTGDCETCECGADNCGFQTSSSLNKNRWQIATELVETATFNLPIDFQQSSSNNAMFGAGDRVLGAFTEFEELCYITEVGLQTQGRGNASSIAVAYKTTIGGAWISAGVMNLGSWNSGVTMTFEINTGVVAIQVQSKAANTGQNNFNSISILDTTP